MEHVQYDLPTLPLNGTLIKRIRDNCTQARYTATCDANYPYRTANGYCNNLLNPEWGSAMTCQSRILQAHYLGK